MPLLDGIRVLDFGRFIAGPYCAALLGDHGADVIRIERVEGGEDRYVPHVAESGEGGLYLQMNRNKRCLTLDLASDEGRAIVRQLVPTADVVVANLPPATLRHLGLDYATLSALNPRLVLTVATAYGASGPYSQQPGFDSVGQALSGAMHMSGLPDAPVRASVNYVDLHTAQACAMGTLAALWARERTGRGQLVEGSLLRSGLIHGNTVLIEQAVKAPNRVPQGNRGYLGAPGDVFRTQTGWLVVQAVGQAMFDRWCEMLDRADLKADPRYASDELRGLHSADISALMSAWCAERTRDEAVAALARARIPAAPVLSPQQALDDPHIQAAGLLPMRPYGDTRYPLAPHPVDLSDTPAGFHRPAPQLGEHTDEILQELGYDAAAIAALRERGVV
ncbi:CaiB/BaiF CoA transferase family protein [Variovorax terrae]|uniref:CoA transferase n=1 Tax=Variovorax terrae TaxID=2923278 RepID=A0A9X2APT7_9BURK|nr:CoA transferase [Variovorax terrae]MCJ0762396.1 CoA transferase [Variovorax terrae]